MEYIRNKISVIVPTYNVQDYIEDFFKSVLSQSYRNLEIIIIDDASTDNSLKIAECYATKDSRIKIIRNEENLGVGKTLCRGYAAASGDFCATISPDDTVDMFYFENLIKRYLETRSDIICGRMLATKDNYMFSDGSELTFYPYAAKISAIFYFYPSLITRKLIVKNNIYDETIVERHWEDILVRCKLAYYANHVSVAPKAIRYYTIRETSLSHKPQKQQEEYQRIAEKRSSEFLKSVGINNVEIKIVNGFKITGGWDIVSWFYKGSANAIENEKTLAQKIFSIKNDFGKKHKVVTIFGIKFKFKRKGR